MRPVAQHAISHISSDSEKRGCEQARKMPVHTCPSIKARVVTRIEKASLCRSQDQGKGAERQCDAGVPEQGLEEGKKQSQEEPGRARIHESTWPLTRPCSKSKDNWEVSGGTQRSNWASKARVPIVKVRSLCKTQHASSRSSRTTSEGNTAGR